MHPHDSPNPLPALPSSTTLHIDRAMSDKHNYDDDAELLSSPTPSQMESEKEKQEQEQDEEEEEEEEEVEQAAAFMRQMQATGPLMAEVGREGRHGNIKGVVWIERTSGGSQVNVKL